MSPAHSSLFLFLAVGLLPADVSCARESRLILQKGSTQFKMAIFADLHFGEAENLTWGPEQDKNSTRVMNRVLEWEHPQLVVFSGDQVTGENIASNATDYWARLVQPCVETETRWVSVFGNHDDLSQNNGTRKELLQFDMSFSLSFSQKGPDGIHGLTNYYQLVWADKNAQSPNFVMYFLDSGGGSYSELVYDDQLEWLKSTAESLRSKVGPLPAIAFFHIPSTGYRKMYKKDLCTGTGNDTVSPQIQPNNLLQTLKVHANVSVTFVGHNHGNDWCCPHPAGLYICYARHTGYGGYGTWDRGSRIIIYDSATGLNTYVRMESGEILWNEKLHL